MLSTRVAASLQAAAWTECIVTTELHNWILVPASLPPCKQLYHNAVSSTPWTNCTLCPRMRAPDSPALLSCPL